MQRKKNLLGGGGHYAPPILNRVKLLDDFDKHHTGKLVFLSSEETLAGKLDNKNCLENDGNKKV